MARPNDHDHLQAELTVLVELSDTSAVLVSCVAWLLIGLVTGYSMHRAPVNAFVQDNWLTKPRRFERHGLWYQRHLRIRSWKDRVPEKGDMFRGGFSKRHLGDRSTPHLERFVAETRRAELVHWGNLGAGPLFFLWCPPLLGGFMIAFGVIAHLPFICIQRYNRERLMWIISRRAARQRR